MLKKIKDFFFKTNGIHMQYKQEFQLVGTSIIVAVRTFQHPYATNHLITMIECRPEGTQHADGTDYSHHVGFRTVWGVTSENMREENGKGVAILPHLARAMYSFYNCVEI